MSGFMQQGLNEVRQAQLLGMKKLNSMKVYRAKQQAFYQLKTGKNLGGIFLISPKIGSRRKKKFHWCVPISEPAELGRDKVTFRIHCEVALTNTVLFTYLLSCINTWPFFNMTTVRINTDSLGACYGRYLPFFFPALISKASCMFLAIREVFPLNFRDVVCDLLLKQSIRDCLIPGHPWDLTVCEDVVFCSSLYSDCK